MSPKEKAEELVTKYAALTITTLGCGYEKGNPCIITNVMFKESAKQCTSIAVDEILNQLNVMDGGFSFEKEIEFWQRVKREIEKL